MTPGFAKPIHGLRRINQTFNFSKGTGTISQDNTRFRNEYAAPSAMQNLPLAQETATAYHSILWKRLSGVLRVKPPSKLEKITGSLPVSAGMTAIAACLGGPAAALLPVLTNTLAHERQKKRVEDALLEIHQRLSKIERLRESLSDAQYKLINELVISILSTADDAKMEHLKSAVFNTPLHDALDMHSTTVLSRILNGISIGELKFSLECHGKRIIFNPSPMEGFYNVNRFSDDGEYATGLVNLGLLARSDAEGTASDVGAYIFTPLADKLVNLIGGENT